MAPEGLVSTFKAIVFLFHLEVEEKKSRKLLEAVLAGLLLVVDPDQRDVVLRAVVSNRLQIFHHLKFELEIMLEGNKELPPPCLASC